MTGPAETSMHKCSDRVTIGVPKSHYSYSICSVYSEKDSMEERLRRKISDADSFHL